ncbi:MAG: HEAT repeat domain-containing protein [Bacteroidota bacterium]
MTTFSIIFAASTIVGLAHSHYLSRSVGWILRKILRPTGKKSKRLLYLSSCLLSRRMDYPRLSYLFFPIPILAVIGILSGNTEAIFALPGGFLAGTLAERTGEKYADQERREMADTIVHQLIQHPAPNRITKVARRALRSRDPVIRQAVVTGLAKVPSRYSFQLLKRRTDDDDQNVAGAARDALSALKEVYAGNRVLSCGHLPNLIASHEHWKRQWNKILPDRAEAYNSLMAVENEIDEIVHSQMALREEYPALMCTECFARPEKLKYEAWEYVRCKKCRDVQHLRKNVQEVVGYIGREKELRFKEGVAWIGLWDEGEKTGQFAEIDRLEVKSGQEIDYNWAISSVVETLRNEWVGEIEFELEVDPLLVLNENTYRNLRSLEQKNDRSS